MTKPNKKARRQKSAHSLVLQRLASDKRESALVPATKKKPRGRPFEKGNKIGNRFKKGEPSANPNGRPPSRQIAQSYRDWISGDVTLEELKRHGLPRELFGHSRAEVVAWVRGEQTLRGDLAAGVELADRSEGKPGTAATGNSGDDPVADLLQGMAQLHIFYGRPEGMPKREVSSDEEGAEIDSPKDA